MKQTAYRIYYRALIISPVLIIASCVWLRSELLVIGLLLSTLLIYLRIHGIGCGDFALYKPEDMSAEMEDITPLVRPGKGMDRYSEAERERQRKRERDKG